MPADKRYSKNRREDFLRYMKGNLSDRERHRIERNLMNDPFEKEAMEGLSEIGPEKAREDLTVLDQGIRSRVAPEKTFKWYRMAAVIAVLIAFSVVFIAVFENRIGPFNRELAEMENNSEISEDKIPEAASVTEKGTTHEEVQRSQGERPSAIPEESIATREEELIPTPEEESGASRIEETPTPLDEKTGVMADEFHSEMEAPEGYAAETADEPSQVTVASKSQLPETELGDYTATNATRTVRGMVVSAEDNQPLPGASVRVKETGRVVISDREGNFSLPVQGDTDNTLVADFIGMESREVEIQDRSEMQIVLQPVRASLDETVIFNDAASKKARTVPRAGAMTVPESGGEQGYRPPEPGTGEDQFKTYIEDHINFPGDSQLNRGSVVLEFNVGLNGRPSNITVLKSPGESFSTEAIRLLEEGPDWKPAEQDGNLVEGTTRIQVVFQK